MTKWSGAATGENACFDREPRPRRRLFVGSIGLSTGNAAATGADVAGLGGGDVVAGDVAADSGGFGSAGAAAGLRDCAVGLVDAADLFGPAGAVFTLALTGFAFFVGAGAGVDGAVLARRLGVLALEADAAARGLAVMAQKRAATLPGPSLVATSC